MKGKYRVVYATGAVKKRFDDFLSKVHEKQRGIIMDNVMNLSDDPRPHKTLGLTLPIKMYDLVAHYRLRIGDFRILYDIDDSQKKVLLLDIRKRDERTYSH